MAIVFGKNKALMLKAYIDIISHWLSRVASLLVTIFFLGHYRHTTFLLLGRT